MTAAVMDATRDYLNRGFAPIPVPYEQKAAALLGWPQLRITELELSRYLDGQPQNIGILLGQACGGLVDIDLDSCESVRIAGGTLPDTNLVTGSKSKPRSHHFYKSRGVKTRRFTGSPPAFPDGHLRTQSNPSQRIKV